MGTRLIRPTSATGLGVVLVVVAFAALPVDHAPPPAAATAAGASGSESGGSLFKVRPGDGTLVKGTRKQARVRVRLTLQPGAQLDAALLNGAKKRRLTRKLAGRATAAAGGRTRISARVGGLRRGRNFLALYVTRGGERQGEQVAVDRATRSGSLIDTLRVRPRRGGAEAKLMPDRLRIRVRAKLNGKSINRAFEDGEPLARRVSLSPKDGLRHGTNRLRVMVRSLDGRYQTKTRRFMIRRRATLPDAGPDRRKRAGLAVRLSGERSKRPVSRSGGRLRYRWTIVDKPAGSHPDLSSRRKRHAVLRTDRTHPGTYVAKLRTAWVAAGAGAGAAGSSDSTDTVSITADAQPRVPLDTFSSQGVTKEYKDEPLNGEMGIAIDVTIDCDDASVADEEPCFYKNFDWGDVYKEKLVEDVGFDCLVACDDSTGISVELEKNLAPTEKLQVLVLDRDTLEPPDDYEDYNTLYDTSNLSGFAAQMQDFATAQSGETCPTYDTDKLVIMALYGGSITDTTNFFDGLDVFNVSTEAADASSTADCTEDASQSFSADGPFSIAGVPGTVAGKAWTNEGATIDTTTSSTEHKGELNGYLKEVSDDPSDETLEVTRGFTFADALNFNTRDAGDDGEVGTDDDELVLDDGSTPVLPSGETDGLNVVSFDTVNPSGTLASEAFITNVGSGEGLDWSGLESVLTDLINDDPPVGSCTTCGIAIVSSGQLGDYSSEPDAADFDDVLVLLDQLGANPDTFARAISSVDSNTPTGYGTYSMLSADGIAYQSSNVIATGADDTDRVLEVYDGTLTGTLLRGSDGQLYPFEGDPAGVDEDSTMLSILYGEQGEWALTPELSGTTASGEEVAFAYIVEQAFPGLFGGDLPALWTTASSGEVTASPSDVRDAALALRSAYGSFSTTLDEVLVDDVGMPSDETVPFTSDDLDAAKIQMIDELADRTQVISLMEVLQDVQTNSQTEVTIDLAQIAEDVQTGALASIKTEIDDETESDSSYYAGLASHWKSALSDVVKLFSVGFVKDGYAWTTLLGDASEAIFDTLDGPSGNALSLTDQYVLLESQLEQEEIDVETQIANTLAAQANGVERSEEVLLSGPTMMSDFTTAAQSTWNFGDDTADVYSSAQNAYLYRVRQLAYQDLWPQVYAAARFRYLDACQFVPVGFAGQDEAYECWDGDEWVVDDAWVNDSDDYESGDTAGSPESWTQASSAECNIFGDVSNPFGDADPGDPSGFGQGTEYQPPVSPDGSQYLDYLMAEASDLTQSEVEGQYPTLADPDVIEPFFAQPSTDASSSSSELSSESAAGFYAPDFWRQNLTMTDRVWCNRTYGSGSDPAMYLDQPGGTYADINQYGGDADVWPTPGD